MRDAPDSPSATVYVDESYSQHDRNFVLVGVIVPKTTESPLREVWRALQRDVHAVLAAEYPLARAHFARHPDVLAEIHAVNMFQSSGYYAKYSRTERHQESYWLQHHAWLQRAFDIFKQHDLDVVAVQIEDTNTLDPRLHGRKRISDLVREALNPLSAVPRPLLESMLSTMDRLERKPFTSSLPLLVTVVDRLLAQRGLVADVVCDDDEENNRFSTFSILQQLQSRGEYRFIRPPVFRNSERESLLQVADIVAYVLRRRLADERAGVASKPLIARWADEYVRPRLVPLPKAVPSDSRRHYGMLAEYVLLNSGGPIEVRRELAEIFTRVLFDALDRES